MKPAKVSVNIHEGYSNCGDGCCDDWFTNVSINGEDVTVGYEPESDTIALIAVLTALGINHEEVPLNHDAEETLSYIFNKMGWKLDIDVKDTVTEDMKLHDELMGEDGLE